ncbi:C13 family peptidase [Burkholderiaceae bacterium UC74_6]
MDEAAIEAQPAPQGGQLARWLVESTRVLMFKAPRWQALRGGAAMVAQPIIAGYVFACIFQHGLLEGDPILDPWAVLKGWPSIALGIWMCWIVVRSSPTKEEEPAPAWMLFALLCWASLVFSFLEVAVFIAARLIFGPRESWPLSGQWAWWLAPVVWFGLVQIRMLWRYARTRVAQVFAVVLTALSLVVGAWLAPVVFWWLPPKKEVPDYRGLVLNQQVVDAQPRLLDQALAQLRPSQSGHIALFAATYAPYATEDVFMRESEVVANTLAERFRAAPRTVQLVVNPATSTSRPWATPSNLHKVIERMATVMNKDNDILFLHLTSHGGADGQLATSTWPLETESITPQLLRQWLDDAGVRWRVISISACYSGSWIAPLAGDDTLVMTAADATHTSYGCGSRSPLTFFGQALYVDALQKTRSFEAAHAQARKLIAAREKDAGKTDGYSNPQISTGAAIRAQLQRLERELDAP